MSTFEYVKPRSKQVFGSAGISCFELLRGRNILFWKKSPLEAPFLDPDFLVARKFAGGETRWLVYERKQPLHIFGGS